MKGKIALLLVILALYLGAAFGIYYMVSNGTLKRTPAASPEDKGKDVSMYLSAAQAFLETKLVRPDGHIDLYVPVGWDGSEDYFNTNSEAVSYYLLWKANEGDKEGFDKELDFVEQKMLHPELGYMMWRVQGDGTVVDDGANIASDADLRAIKALLIAEERWNDERYTNLIDKLAYGLEKVAITEDGYLSPYGGASGPDSGWTADEVWLSYSDFTVFRELAQRRGEPWKTLNAKMKEAVLDPQIHNGLYNSMLTNLRAYGNGIDGGKYAINSLWIMVRAAESGDPELMESAKESLEFYKKQYQINAELYAEYGSNGDPLSPGDSPWVYALVGRAAVALDDKEFAGEMIDKLISKQVLDQQSSYYGGFPEGSLGEMRIGQFTVQESILTLQDYEKMEV